MKYISRTETEFDNLYTVKIGFGDFILAQKIFKDAKSKGRCAALKAAKKWRDKEVVRLTKKHRNKNTDRERSISCGVNIKEDPRFNPPRVYYHCTYWCNEEKKQLIKTYNIDRYGEKIAKLYAQRWRKFMVTGEL